MRLVDTSAWIEWLAQTFTATALAPLMPGRDEWLVPTIVQLELTKYLLREGTQSDVELMLAFCRTCVITDLDTSLAVSAAEACRQHKLSTADAVIYATAQAHGADLLTCDAHFEALPGVVYIAKTET